MSVLELDQNELVMKECGIDQYEDLDLCPPGFAVTGGSPGRILICTSPEGQITTKMLKPSTK